MTGAEMHALVERLYPLPRSLTGDGVRETLAVLGERLPLEVHEVPTGTPVLDWTVPREWNLREAWIAGPDGRRIVDAAESNLHVVGYSVPVRERMSLSELQEHLHSLPEQPDLIPYRTSYWKETWGFCIQDERRQSLPEGEYEVVIDTVIEDGSLTYGELLIEGDAREEVLISTHVCHPSLANDNLSGIVVASEVAARVLEWPERRFSYRFVFVPGTIGPITWLARNEEAAARVAHGLVLTLLGDDGAFTYKRSRRGHAEIDRAAEHVIGEAGEVRDFSPWGYDERQYCSPGFDLPMGRLTRTPHGEFPEYHTSADDLSLVTSQRLEESADTVEEVLQVLEGNGHYLNLQPKGEPQLGRRGLYGSLGGGEEGRERELAMLWVLNYSDGSHSLLDIAARGGLSFPAVRDAADALLEHDLLRDAST